MLAKELVSCLLSRKPVLVFFTALLLVGLYVYDDYGVSCDEIFCRQRGLLTFRYVFYGDDSLLAYRPRFHGTAFEFPLSMAENILDLGDSRDVFLMRHLCTFLTFYVSVFFFYLLCKRHFRDWRMGLLGCVFLVLSPRIFADSFYNSKDLVFMSVFIIAAYTMLKYLEKKTITWSVGHALACAMLVDIRVLGILIPFVTVILALIGIDDCAIRGKDLWKSLRSFVVYIVMLALFVILFWPYLWGDPLNRFMDSLEVMKKFPNYFCGIVLYRGEYIQASMLPWHYLPVWIVITTPPVYLLLFIAGLFACMAKILPFDMRRDVKKGLIVSSRWGRLIQEREVIVFLLWFFTPPAAAILLNSTLYDGWRHVFFIYPALLMISLTGLASILGFINIQLKGSARKTAIYSLTAIIVISLLHVIYFMVENHPHQMVYFNLLAGNNIRNNFELDYWGLSYRQALEYILSHDNRSNVTVRFANHCITIGPLNLEILKPEDRARITMVNSNPDYLLSNYRWHREDYPYPAEDEFYSITAGGEKIMVAYKPQYGTVVDDWLVCGAFNAEEDNGLDTDYINESTVEPTAGGDCGGMTWKTYNTPDGLVDFHGRFKTVSNQMVAYAATYVNSPMDMTVDLWYGSDCATKMWLNGMLVENNPAMKSAVDDVGHLEARLKKGRNMLLAKTCIGSYGWRFYVKIKQSGLGVSTKAV